MNEGVKYYSRCGEGQQQKCRSATTIVEDKKGGGQRVHTDTGAGTGPSAALSVVTVVARIGASRVIKRRKRGEGGRRRARVQATLVFRRFM